MKLEKRLTQIEKFKLKYGEDYKIILGSKYDIPLDLRELATGEKDYNEKGENVLIPENFKTKENKQTGG